MPTSPQSKPNNVLVIDTLTQHLLQVINHLQQDNFETPFKLLLISDPEVTEQVITPIQDVYPDIDITTFSTNQFLQANFDSRYTLGCFIDAQLLDGQLSKKSLKQKKQPLQAASVKVNQPYKQQHLIAMRLRDLFAQQSVIFLTKQADIHTSISKTSLHEKKQLTTINAFHALGYIATPISPATTSVAETTDNNLFNSDRA